jgi:hypothetical protein
MLHFKYNTRMRYNVITGDQRQEMAQGICEVVYESPCIAISY